ncbi:MAG: VTT domain-containing protein [Candidatus Thorarchaeota archaeon]
MQDIVQIVIDLILQGYLGLFLACFIVNMIPFISPSNMVLAGLAMLLMFPEQLDVGLAIQVGVVVALSATMSKLALYATMRGSRVVLSENMITKIDYERERVEKWGAIALLISAGSPVPDDPIVIYCGLTQYSIPKFLVSYSLGKVAVTIPGALIASAVSAFFGSVPSILGSIALTAIILGVVFKRRTEGEETDSYQESIEDEILDSDEESSSEADR